MRNLSTASERKKGSILYFRHNNHVYSTQEIWEEVFLYTLLNAVFLYALLSKAISAKMNKGFLRVSSPGF